MEYSLSILLNMARNQNYEQSPISLDQLVDLYLGFEETKSTGEILLREITYLAKLQ